MAEPPEKVRAFISVNVKPEIVRALRHFQRGLEDAVPKEAVRWVAPEHMHLTLRFLGSIAAEDVDPITAALHGICAQGGPFQLRAAGLGSFPNLRSPRVIWVGLQGELPQLQRLQAQIEDATRHVGEPPESRGFHPHLTLGRVREAAARQTRSIGEVLQAIPVPAFGEWHVKEVRLMRSKLSPNGAQYSVLAVLPLAREWLKDATG